MKPSIQELFDQLSKRLDRLEADLKKPEVQLGHRILFDEKRAGEVPAPGKGDPDRFLRQDRQWVEVSAQGEVTGTNIGLGVGVHASASDGIMTFRTITGSAGTSVYLSGSTIYVEASGGGGGTSTAVNLGTGSQIYKEQSASEFRFRTLTASFGSGLQGSLSTDANHVYMEISNSGSGSVNLGGFFGTGLDGALVFDGGSGAAALGLTPSSASYASGRLILGGPDEWLQYSLTRDIFATDMSIASHVLVHTRGYRVFVNGTLTIDGRIGAPGQPGQNGGGASGGGEGIGYADGTVAGSNDGGFGASASSVADNSEPSATCPPGYSNSGGTAGTGVGGDGVAGVAGKGGGGGSGGGASISTSGGAITLVGATQGSLDDIFQAVAGHGLLSITRYSAGSGGGGGASDPAGGGGVAGGGGAGGGACVLFARTIVGTGTVTVRGGAGGAAYSGVGATKGGGGGGGGGGWLILATNGSAVPTVDYGGGTGGVKFNAAAGNGGDGGPGLYKLYRIGDGAGGGTGGGSMSSVIHDTTMTGDGVATSPLSASPLSGTINSAIVSLSATLDSALLNLSGTIGGAFLNFTGGGGGGSGSGTLSNIWDYPTSPHEWDDEFDSTALSGTWTELGTPAGTGSWSNNTIDPYAGFNSGPPRYAIHHDRRRSWLMMQPPNDAGFYGFYKPLTGIPTNMFMWMRGSFSSRLSTSTNNDAGLQFIIAADSGGAPDFNNRLSLALNETDTAIVQSEFNRILGGALTTVAVGFDYQAGAQQINPTEGIGLQKIGTTYYAWMFGSNGTAVYMGSITFAPTPAWFIIITTNAGPLSAPGNMISGVDFVRFVSSSVFLP